MVPIAQLRARQVRYEDQPWPYAEEVSAPQEDEIDIPLVPYQAWPTGARAPCASGCPPPEPTYRPIRSLPERRRSRRALMVLVGYVGASRIYPGSSTAAVGALDLSAPVVEGGVGLGGWSCRWSARSGRPRRGAPGGPRAAGGVARRLRRL
ncbi:hypothetical protein [Modestobacter marinus]|uniref:hypothetical protein n=1 Tax=Modestobacter marinus TaxID=477641 RepID=UPI001C969C1E|nr:hypothetical protein [Modestobacter marinus]